MALEFSSPSVIEYFPDHSGYECGYCKGTETSFSHGMWAHTMTVQDYQDLIDRGWRRSGKYVYKPTMEQTCCPQYPIRCDVRRFTLNKSHKKIIKKVNRYLTSGMRPTCSNDSTDGSGDHGDAGTGLADYDLAEERIDEESLAKDIPNDLPGVKAKKLDSTGTPEKKIKTSVPCPLAKTNTEARNSKPAAGRDPNKPACKKAKVLRLERWKAKHKNDPEALKKYQAKLERNKAKSLDALLNEVGENPAYNLQVRLVRSSPRSDLFTDTLEESFQVYKKYQMVVHNDPESKITMQQFTRFLVDSPLQEEESGGHLPDGYGSFHQQYLLDGKIVAVGVLDILPRCASSVYLYYDPAYFFLALGTYSALREIQFVQHLHELEPSIEYYYLGFYIHSCTKMRYKGQYNPSFLLCPQTYNWCNIEHCHPLLDKSKYCRFAPPEEKDEQGDPPLDQVMVLHCRRPMPYCMYRQRTEDDEESEDQVKEYAALVGRRCSENMLLFRS